MNQLEAKKKKIQVEGTKHGKASASKSQLVFILLLILVKAVQKK